MMKRYQLNAESSIPLYKQIVEIIYSMFENGELSPGEKLPSEMELMDIFGVSRITVRGAIDELQNMQLVKRSRGKGTYVTAELAKHSEGDRVGFMHSCELSGKSGKTELIDVSWMYPNISDIEFLKIDEDELILSTKRLHFVDDIATIIETNHYTKRFAFLENEDLSGDLYEILIRHDVKRGKSLKTLEVCYADPQEAMMLNIKKGDALLLFTDMVMDQEGHPMYISRQVYCTERLKFYL